MPLIFQPMKSLRQTLMAATVLVGACGDATDVESLAQVYVLARANNQSVPAPVLMEQFGTTTATGTIVRGAIEFTRRDTARVTLHTEYRTIGADGSATEEACFTTPLPYTRVNNRVHFDLEIPAVPGSPSTGFPGTPGVSIHDTLFVSGTNLVGNMRIRFTMASQQKHVVKLEYRAASGSVPPCTLSESSSPAPPNRPQSRESAPGWG